MPTDLTPAERQKAEKWLADNLLHCIGCPECGGDLEEMKHSSECPCQDPGPPECNWPAMLALYARSRERAAQRDAVERCIKVLCVHCARGLPLCPSVKGITKTQGLTWTHTYLHSGDVGMCYASMIRSEFESLLSEEKG